MCPKSFSSLMFSYDPHKASLIWLVVIVMLTGISTSAQTFTDSGFAVETVATLPVFTPVGITFASDGRMFITQKGGVIRIVKNGTLLTAPFIDISARVNRNGDRGLMGFALDPNFSSNGFAYLLYVFEEAGNPNDGAPKTARLTRVKVDPANPDVALANSEVVLVGTIGTVPCSEGADCIPSDSTSHTVGTVKFGPDGKLYMGMGDGGFFTFIDARSLRAQNLNFYNGKILRLNPDGTAPSDNPFYDGTNSVKSKVYNYGLRNPFRFTIHPTTGEVMMADVGQSTWEEINRGRGQNFGWPCFEGNAPEPDFQSQFPQTCSVLPTSAVTFPLYAYPTLGGSAVIGGPFYTATQFPADYRGNFFFGDYVKDFIRRMVFDANNNVIGVQDFATHVGAPVDLQLGPDGSLYYVSITTGEIRRIFFNSNLPVAVASYSRPSAAQPSTIAFSSNGSSDPGGSALTYLWEFGDGTNSTAVAPVHTYTVSGAATFTVKLTVTNAQGLKGASTLSVIVGSRPPVATITSPNDGTRANIGDTITFTGTASDPDETLPTSAMNWTVLLHHTTHVHPGITFTGPTGSFPIENHSATGETFFYEVVLTVTDSSGLTDTKRVNVIPATAISTLPAPWLGQEVGNVGLPGSASFASEIFTVNGSGLEINNFDDGFYYTYQKLSGDGQIVARVTGVQNTAAGAKAGVMIRESLAANAAHALISLSPVRGVEFLRRDATGFGTALASAGYFAAPYWVKLVRSGNTISGYHSSDGVNWILLSSSANFFIANDVFVGLAVTSNNNAALCTATFDNVSVGTPNNPPTVNLTAPAAGATYTAPANITITANAADNDGTISKVEFYQGTTLLNTDASAPYSFIWTNVTAGTYALTTRAYDDKGAVTTSSPVNISVSNPANGTGDGLKGEYFRSNNLTRLSFTRTDGTVNFDWGSGSPSIFLGRDDFSVRWSGVVQPRFSGTYTFYGFSTDGVRVFVNNQLLLNKLATKNGNIEGQGQLTLTAGQNYPIVVEFYQKDKDKTAAIKLEWSSSQQTREIIPRSQLYPQ